MIQMIKLFIKYKLTEYAINTFFNKMINNFNPTIIKLNTNNLTDEHIGMRILNIVTNDPNDYEFKSDTQYIVDSSTNRYNDENYNIQFGDCRIKMITNKHIEYDIIVHDSIITLAI
jgi:hypothetical protein